MMQYKVDRQKSRDTEDDYIKCEFGSCGCPAVDIHHILSSFRAKRKHRKDGSDLIALCSYHHKFAHDHNDHEMRQGLLRIAEIITTYHKEKNLPTQNSQT